MKVSFYRAILLLLVMAGLSACSEKKQAEPEVITAKMQQEIRETVSDPVRAEKVIELTDEVNVIISEAAEDRKRDMARIDALNADYDATEEAFGALLDDINAKAKSRYMRFVAINTELKSLLTSKEWEHFNDLRKELLKSDGKLL